MREKLFTVISPVYNVGKYLPDYFESLEAQTVGIENLEIILVDDGSVDDSLSRCQAFAETHPNSVRVIHKENGGQASARNLGLELASTPWICFPDPDDVLSDNFFEAIHDFMEKPGNERTALFAGHIIIWDERTGRRRDSHATSFRFAGGNSTTNLEGKPNFIHGNAVMSFFKRDLISQAGLRFDERLRTRFEDGSFIAQYLLEADEPILGLVDDARYFYRRRAEGNSTNQTSHGDPRSYTDVPEYGWLTVLKIAKERKGYVPRWLQWYIVYDIAWLFKEDVGTKIPTRTLTADVLSTFHALVRQVMGYIEPEAVLGFDMMGVPAWTREALTFAYRQESYVGPVSMGPPDASRNLIRISYRFKGDLPEETIFVRGKRVEPRYAKTQLLEVLGDVVLKERHLWVSSLGVIRFELNGRIQRLLNVETGGTTYKFRRAQVESAEQELARGGIPPIFLQRRVSMRDLTRQRLRNVLRWGKRTLRKPSIYDLSLAAALRLIPIRRAYAGAWVLMDREFQANDSAEELYRWIRAHQPDTKMRFVIRKESAEWARLKRDGFELVDYGSYRWKLLMLLAGHVISSHIDVYISNPLPSRRYGRPQWKLSFLQHGIIKGDLSPWLNRKNIDFFLTSTKDEYEYISGESPFKFSKKEVRLTGLPRHDALLQKSMEIEPSEVNQVLIAPTWRQYLSGRIISTSVREQNEQFMESDYAKAWQSLVQSEELREIASKRGLKLVFMPHPNIQPYLGNFAVPDWVETRHYGDVDVQDVVRRTAVMITDYSSIAFNMAYLYRPAVYYQFDKSQYEAEHIEGKGYYEYERDGFGPVSSDLQGVLKGLDSLLSEPKVAEEYAERARRTFPVRDGKNSERVFNAIKDLERPLSFQEGSVRAETDAWDFGAALDH
ncbi:bifunctional glycosyltransferase/CDP-glycerol:glycerophosphate glycerophosphotransferase [Cryobacterium tepidiphilum]|uniref:Glycosyltransferase n=1 Tax=Cryobacterium tepidiphilum TaxID=2486026 RepID=A0A3M8L314_9MICO|nr:CDP-glycerol glycerophosphotransferase family protein [Cryobacterium tepidiphilum]RNE59088.1 glycosyltransferase [Cryobacterium tepidiphilum]